MGIVAVGVLGSAGCQVIGAVASTVERTTPKKVKAEHLGLQDATFAVLVQCDRGIQSEQPLLVEELSRRMTQRLSAATNVPRAKGFVPADDVLAFTYRNPAWHLRTPDRLAKDLGGVDRVIIVEVTEFRLHEPGNQYLWSGRATARVSVGNSASGEFDFDRVVSVRFPDSEGMGPEDIGRQEVGSVLLSRLVDRASWLFYDHEEAGDQKY
jgi:hypothetical protein